MARAVELDRLTKEGPTYRVWCTSLRRYVLSNVSRESVCSYYLEMSRSRAVVAAESDLQGALERGLLPPRTAVPVGGH